MLHHWAMARVSPAEPMATRFASSPSGTYVDACHACMGGEGTYVSLVVLAECSCATTVIGDIACFVIGVGETP